MKSVMEYYFNLLVFVIPYLALSPWQKFQGVPTGIFFVALAGLFILGLVISRPDLLTWRRIIETPLIIPLGMFILANLVSLVSFIMSQGFSGVQVEGLAEIGYWFFAVAFYWAIINYVDNKEKLLRAIKVFILTITLASLYGISKLLLFMGGFEFGAAQGWTVPRLIGTAGEAQVFGGLIITVLPLAVAIILYKIADLESRWNYLAVPIMLLALIMNFSAGPWAGFGLALMFLLIWIYYYNLKQAMAVILVFLITGLSIIIVDKTIYPNYLEAFRSIAYKITGKVPPPEKFINKGTYETLKEHSLPTPDSKDAKYLESLRSKVERSWFRITLWNMFESSPLVGVGPGNFGKLYNQYKPVGAEAPPYIPKPHNQYMEIVAETGLIGLFTFIWIIASLINRLFQSWLNAAETDKKLIIGMIASLLAVGLHGYSFAILVHIQVWLLLGLSICIGIINQSHREVGQFENRYSC
ncbi:MAG: O-antigen ligase family protein [Thermincolia bacterium]